MFNSVALDVVIGLVFIYLLYSLLATVLSEIIATNLGLRARNLKVAVNRMLTDEKEPKYHKHWSLNSFYRFLHGLRRVLESINFLKNPKNRVLDDFYNHPEIKYLGNTGIFSSPSTFKAISFSKTLLQVITRDQPPTSEIISKNLKDMVLEAEAAKNSQQNTHTPGTGKYFDLDTARYLLNMWQEAGADINKFKLELENWFDRTMEHATEWYKRNIQVILLFIGFSMATFFNADSFVIISKLSNDKEARKQMVELASAYVEKNPSTNQNGGVSMNYSQEKLDSLLQVKKVLEEDITNANQILGSGSSLPKSVYVLGVDTIICSDSTKSKTCDTVTKVLFAGLPVSFRGEDFNIEGNIVCVKDTTEKVGIAEDFDTSNFSMSTLHFLNDSINFKAAFGYRSLAELRNSKQGKAVKTHKKIYAIEYEFTVVDQLSFYFKLIRGHFWGYLLTAIAISLGAPFWFDLLNKLMRLRSSEKQDTDTPRTSIPQQAAQTPIAVSVNTSTNELQEAVG